MLMTGLAQLRFAASLVLGRPFALWSLDHLVDAISETQREFGRVGADAAAMIQGPSLDEADRQELHLRRFRRQAVRAAEETAYYRHVFEQLSIDPARLRYAEIASLPLTPKEALREDPDAFVRATARPAFRTTTTGTTGKPTCVCFSAHEMQSYIALAAISLLLQHQVTSADIVQLSTSARATLGNTCFAHACERIDALWYQTGLVDPAQALALLAERHTIAGKKPQVSFLNTYASYLGQLVEYGLAAGYQPVDFGLEHISVGGEVVTTGLKTRCQALFGPVHFIEGYGITELWPLGGTLCSQGHLHFELSQGLLEVINPETGMSAQPGEAGNLVATPFPPYRETTLVLRYDTQDVVRPLTQPLTCELRHLPATTDLLGKRHLSVQHEQGWTYPRNVLEALESIEAVPLPARCGFWAVPGGVAVAVLTHTAGRSVRQQIEQALEAQGVPVAFLHLVESANQVPHPLPLRCDLRELTFSQPPAAGASYPSLAEAFSL